MIRGTPTVRPQALKPIGLFALNAMERYTDGPMNSSDRVHSMTLISNDIRRSGYHVSVINQGCMPRYVYSIGLRSILGFELILPGAAIYMLDEVIQIIRYSISYCEQNQITEMSKIETSKLGIFRLRKAHSSWIEMLMLGAIDYFHDSAIVAYQILPDIVHTTIDVPDLAVTWDAQAEPVWRWLRDPWELPIPASSSAVTNLAALRGARVTEASRWELDEWDLFAGPGPDTSKNEVRIVPIGTLLAVDATLEAVLSLDVGKSLWRDGGNSEWNEW
jgi:hypothetical protein